MENVRCVKVVVFNRERRFGEMGECRLWLYKGITPSGAYRYMIRGDHNPFPVHNGSWFCGLPEGKMVGSLEREGFKYIAEARCLKN